MKKMLPLAIGAALLAASSGAFAITDEEGNASLQFNFSAPGARSLAMGGAFIGLADDATAAFSNPAGLVQLASKEVSFEQRINDYNTEYVRSGSYTPDPFNINGLSYDEARSSTHSPSFVSFVWPHERWAVAVYRHEFLNYETSFASSGVDSGLAGGVGGREVAEVDRDHRRGPVDGRRSGPLGNDGRRARVARGRAGPR